MGQTLLLITIRRRTPLRVWITPHSNPSARTQAGNLCGAKHRFTAPQHPRRPHPPWAPSNLSAHTQAGNHFGPKHRFIALLRPRPQLGPARWSPLRPHPLHPDNNPRRLVPSTPSARTPADNRFFAFGLNAPFISLLRPRPPFAVARRLHAWWTLWTHSPSLRTTLSPTCPHADELSRRRAFLLQTTLSNNSVALSRRALALYERRRSIT